MWASLSLRSAPMPFGLASRSTFGANVVPASARTFDAGREERLQNRPPTTLPKPMARVVAGSSGRYPRLRRLVPIGRQRYGTESCRSCTPTGRQEAGTLGALLRALADLAPGQLGRATASKSWGSLKCGIKSPLPRLRPPAERPPMALTFFPDPGTVLMCDFTTGFREPEMVKKRPVAVVSHKFQTTRPEVSVCTVVPISTVRPTRIERWHHRLAEDSIPVPLREMGKESWAKCDLVVSVAFHRLDKVRSARIDGVRTWIQHTVTSEALQSIQRCLLYVLNMQHLIDPTE